MSSSCMRVPSHVIEGTKVTSTNDNDYDNENETNIAQTVQSPQVEVKWGEVKCKGEVFKDAVVWPGGVEEWNWAHDGTRHRSGVTMTAIDRLTDKGVTILFLTKGFEGVLTIPETIVSYAEMKGMIVVVDLTESAVKQYNELAQNGHTVGALIHSTC